jgi:hypothetical protein
MGGLYLGVTIHGIDWYHKGKCVRKGKGAIYIDPPHGCQEGSSREEEDEGRLKKNHEVGELTIGCNELEGPRELDKNISDTQ